MSSCHVVKYTMTITQKNIYYQQNLTFCFTAYLLYKSIHFLVERCTIVVRLLALVLLLVPLFSLTSNVFLDL